MTMCITSCDGSHHTFSFSLGDSTEFVDSIYIETKAVLTQEEKSELREFVTTHMKRGEDINIILDKTLVLTDAKKVKFERTYINNASFLPTEAREICLFARKRGPEYDIVIGIILVFLGFCFSSIRSHSKYIRLALEYNNLVRENERLQRELKEN